MKIDKAMLAGVMFIPIIVVSVIIAMILVVNIPRQATYVFIVGAMLVPYTKLAVKGNSCIKRKHVRGLAIPIAVIELIACSFVFGTPISGMEYKGFNDEIGRYLLEDTSLGNDAFVEFLIRATCGRPGAVSRTLLLYVQDVHKISMAETDFYIVDDGIATTDIGKLVQEATDIFVEMGSKMQDLCEESCAQVTGAIDGKDVAANSEYYYSIVENVFMEYKDEIDAMNIFLYADIGYVYWYLCCMIISVLLSYPGFRCIVYNVYLLCNKVGIKELEKEN